MSQISLKDTPSSEDATQLVALVSNPIRITAAIDKETAELLEKESKEVALSQSEIIRRAIRFYHEHKNLAETSLQKKIRIYMDMLLSGEHVILDVSHWLLFLNLIENSPIKDSFWKDCREVARSHAEQFKSRILGPRDLLERLEACNFFRMNADSETEFTLVLFSETSKEFVKLLLEEIFGCMKIQAEIKVDLAKIRVVIKEPHLKPRQIRL